MPLGLGTLLRSFRFQSTIGSVRLQFARLDVIVQKTGKHFVDDLVAQRRIFHRERHFDAPEKISRHPIGAGEEDLWAAGIFKIINPAVFEKSADDADDANIFAQAGNFRAQTTDAADDQIDLHAGAGSFVKFLDDLLIDERIEFRDHAGRFACPSVIAFALDQPDEAAAAYRMARPAIFPGPDNRPGQ